MLSLVQWWTMQGRNDGSDMMFLYKYYGSDMIRFCPRLVSNTAENGGVC